MAILITGASGFVGRRFCNKAGNNAIALCRKIPENTGVAAETGDVSDIKSLRPVFNRHDISAIVHLASPSDWKSTDPMLYVNGNIAGTINILECMKENNVKNLVFASSQTVYGGCDTPNDLPISETYRTRPKEFYGLSKLVAENYCRIYSHTQGINACVLRFGSIFGAGMKPNVLYNFTRSIRHDQKITITGTGKQTGDQVYVDDIVDALGKSVELLKKEEGFHIFNIGGGTEISVLDIANTVLRLTGSGIKPDFAPGDSSHRFVMDISKARKELGYSPRTFEDGMKAFIKEAFP